MITMATEFFLSLSMFACKNSILALTDKRLHPQAMGLFIFRVWFKIEVECSKLMAWNKEKAFSQVTSFVNT